MIQKFPRQIPSIALWWYGSGGGTSGRPGDSTVPLRVRSSTRKGHMMVFISHNTDFGDAFEQEAAEPRYFYTFSVDGYTSASTSCLRLTH